MPLHAQTAQPSLAVSRITAAIDENSRVTLKGTVHPLANAANDRGAAPDSMPLQRLHLVLKRSPAQETALRQLVSDMHTPGSASYHKWLTPEQFGPSDQDVATVQSWLGSHGFLVGKVQPGKQVIEFSGNVAQMRDAFHTQIHKYVVNQAPYAIHRTSHCKPTSTITSATITAPAQPIGAVQALPHRAGPLFSGWSTSRSWPTATRPV